MPISVFIFISNVDIFQRSDSDTFLYWKLLVTMTSNTLQHNVTHKNNKVSFEDLDLHYH
jgi:hypothetical protein